jgi:nucleoside-diphosphate-sugar epimerase
MKTVAIAGSGGFVGRHLLEHFEQTSYDAFGLKRWNSQAPIERTPVDEHVCDLTDSEKLLQHLAGASAVIYSIAPPPSDDRLVESSASLMRQFLKVGRQADLEHIVVISCATSAIDDDPTLEFSEENVYSPGSLGQDAEAVYAAELECYRQAADGQPITILNPTICLGDGAVIPSPELLSNDVNGETPLDIVSTSYVCEVAEEALFEDNNYGSRYLLEGQQLTAERFHPFVSHGDFDALRHVDAWDSIRAPSLYGHGGWFDGMKARYRFDV